VKTPVTQERLRGPWTIVAGALALALGALILPAAPARGQATTELILHPDFGGGGPVPGVGGVFTLGEAEGERPASSNDRFHVFEQFDLAAGDTVEWVGAPSTRNIFNLVTGGDRSLIDGRLRSTLDADIYLVNPEGILFGPGAELDVGASFFASTADRIDFEDGGRLEVADADAASVASLSVADFSAFGFLGAAFSIDIDGSALGVADDAVLGLYADRHVRIDAAPDDSLAALQAGRVELSTDSGDILIRGGRITSVRGAVAGGAGVVIDADEAFVVANGSGVESHGELGVAVAARSIEVEDAGSEILSLGVDVAGGDLELVAQQRITVRDRARIASEASGTGDAGDIRIEARDLLLLDATIESASSSNTNGQGDIELSIDRVANLIDGRIESEIDDAGAGRVTLEAPLVVAQGDSRIASRASSVEIEADLFVRSGDTEIEAPRVEIRGNEIVRSLQTDLNERLEVLPQSFFERRVQLDKRCAARSGEALGSLVIDPQRIAEDRPEDLRRAYYGTRRATLEAATPLDAQTWNLLPDWFGEIPTPDADDWLALAQRAERMGNLPRAVEAAGQGIRIGRDPVARAGLHAVRGRIRAQLEDPRGAGEDFTAASTFADEAGGDGLRAAVALDRATARLRAHQFERALPALVLALDLATRARADATRLAIEANLISGLLAAGETDRARARIVEHSNSGVETLATEDELTSALHIALAAIRAEMRQQGADQLVALARQGLEFDHSGVVALAWAYLAGLYAEEERLDEAIALTSWAIEASLASDERTRLASLEVQLADFLREAGDLVGAARTYQMALESLPWLVSGGPRRFSRDPFTRKTVEESVSVTTSLVDVLLQTAARTESGEARQALIREARDQVEAERVRELRDHFRDPCIQALERRPADSIPGAVIVHPVLMSDRLALIVSGPDGLNAYDVALDRREWHEWIARTQRALRDRTTNRYRLGAARLYEWIARPIEHEWARPEIETLVFVTGGAMRDFPLAALYDERENVFLIEKRAVAFTPGLTLTRPRAIGDRALVMLRAGLEGAPGDAPALPQVTRELDALSQMFSGVDLRGADFVPERLERALEQRSFDLIHIASHGVFPASGEPPYLATAGRPIELADLAAMVRRTRFRDRPTELITLSACETAVSHRAAALGFAGLAVQSGARSTLGTVWRVSDEASAEFMQAFYEALANGEGGRAAALRAAQRGFLDNPVLSHPYFWAPYLLLGNWQ